MSPFEKQKTSTPSADKRRKDVTRYEFQGEVYCKRQLVLACVKHIVQTKQVKTINDMEDLFPSYVQGPLGIVRRVEEAERYSGASKRFYFGDEDIIHLKNADCVVCSQWESENIKRFLQLAKELKLEIQVVERKYK